MNDYDDTNDSDYIDVMEEVVEGIALARTGSQVIERSRALTLLQYADMSYTFSLEGAVHGVRGKQYINMEVNRARGFGGPIRRYLPTHCWYIEVFEHRLRDDGVEFECDEQGRPLKDEQGDYKVVEEEVKAKVDGKEITGKQAKKKRVMDTIKTRIYLRAFSSRRFLTDKQQGVVARRLARQHDKNGNKLKDYGKRPLTAEKRTDLLDSKGAPPIHYTAFMALSPNAIEKYTQKRSYFTFTPKYALVWVLQKLCRRVADPIDGRHWRFKNDFRGDLDQFKGILRFDQPDNPDGSVDLNQAIVEKGYWPWGGMEEWVPQISRRISLAYDIHTKEDGPIIRLGSFRDFEIVHFIKYITDPAFFDAKRRYQWYLRLRKLVIARLRRRLRKAGISRDPRNGEILDELEKNLDWWLPSTQIQYIEELEDSIRFDNKPDPDKPTADIERPITTAERAQKLFEAVDMLSYIVQLPEVSWTSGKIHIDWDTGIIEFPTFEEVRDLVRFCGHFRMSRSMKWMYDSGEMSSADVNRATGDDWGGAQSRSRFGWCWVWRMLDRMYPHPGRPPDEPREPVQPVEPAAPPRDLEGTVEHLQEVQIYDQELAAYKEARDRYENEELLAWQQAYGEWLEEAQEWYRTYTRRRRNLFATADFHHKHRGFPDSEMPAMAAFFRIWGSRMVEILEGIKNLRGATAQTREGGILKRDAVHEKLFPGTRKYPMGEWGVLILETIMTIDPRGIGQFQKGLRNDSAYNELFMRQAAQVFVQAGGVWDEEEERLRPAHIPQIWHTEVPEAWLPKDHQRGLKNKYNQNGIARFLWHNQRTDAIIERVKELFDHQDVLDTIYIWALIEREITGLPADVIRRMGDQLDEIHRCCDNRVCAWAMMKGVGPAGGVRAWKGGDGDTAVITNKYGGRINQSNNPHVFFESNEEIVRILDWIWRNGQVDHQVWWLRAWLRVVFNGNLDPMQSLRSLQSAMQGGLHPDFAFGAMEELTDRDIDGVPDLRNLVTVKEKAPAEAALEQSFEQESIRHLGLDAHKAIRGGRLIQHIREQSPRLAV